MQAALLLALAVAGLGVATGAAQLRGWRRLRARSHVPSDEYGYLRNRYRRRGLTAVVLVAIGALIGTAYLTGMEHRADHLGPAPEVEAGGPPAMTPDQRQFVRFWGVYWIVVMVLTNTLLVLAFADAVATRRYWMKVYRVLRDDHEAKLRRDLAVYKQHVEQSRNGRFGTGDSGSAG